MYKCRVQLSNAHFRDPERTEFGAKDIVATIEPLQDISAIGKAGGPPVFELVPEPDPDHPGETRQVIRVHPPTDEHRARLGMGPYNNGFQLLYQLPTSADKDKNFTIIGIAFKKEANAHVGELEFPLVHVNRDDDASELAVIDLCDHPQDYTYGIVMQHVDSGNLGIFDPGIKNLTPDSIPG